MKIGCVGIGGTGKSKLSRWMEGEYHWPFNPTGARSTGARSTAAAMGFVHPETGEGRPFNVDRANGRAYRQCIEDGETPFKAAEYATRVCSPGTPALQTCRPLFQVRLAEAKIVWEDSRFDFITDRTPLDDVAYALLHCPEIVTEAFLVRAYRHTATYDTVFFFPRSAGQWLHDDAAREGGTDYYIRLEVVIRGLIAGLHAFADAGGTKQDTLNIFEEIRSDDFEERQKQVRATVRWAQDGG